MSTCRSSGLIFLFFGVVFYSGCKKESSIIDPPNTHNSQLSVEDIIAKYGSYEHTGGVFERSGTKLPLDFIPIWKEASVYADSTFPLILVPVDTPCICPGSRFGGNFAFFRDQFGEIKSRLLLWETDSLSPYAANSAPLRTNSNFSGWMLSVSELDSVNGIAKIINGNVVSSKKGAYSFYDLPIIANLPGANTADDRDWPPRWLQWLFGQSGEPCPNNLGPDGGGWWNEFWRNIGSFFASNIWDTEDGEHVSYSPFNFFFGNGLVNPGDGYVPPGSSSVFDQNWVNQNNTCTFIRQYIESIGEIPAGYSQADLRYCQLVSDLGIDAASSRCLFAQYGSSFIDNFYEHWEQSDKSIATAELLKKYLTARCQSSPSVLFADIIKQQFCLHGSSMDIWLELMDQCGTNEQSFEQGLGVDPNLSSCIQGLVKKNRKSFFQTYGINLSDAQLGNLIDICEYSDILNESSMPCFAKQLQAFNNKYGVNLLDEGTAEMALDCFMSNSGCGGGAFEECVINTLISGFIDPPAAPINDPISTFRRICPSVFTFYTRSNWATGTPLKAATLTNVHFSFSFNGSQLPLQIGNLCIEVNQYSGGPTCLLNADATSASAINTAVDLTQNFINTLDPSLPLDQVNSQIKFFLFTRINRELQRQFSDCDSKYGAGANNPTSAMSFNIAYDVTPTNCDIKMADCN